MKREKLGYVVADGGRAKLISRNGSGHWETLTEFDCEPMHRPHNDSRTRVFESLGGRRSAVGDPQDDRNRLAEEFAVKIDEAIAQAVAKGEFQKFIMAAPPRMLGAMRRHMHAELQERVVGELAKDLTKLPDPELHERLERLSL